MRSFTSTFEDFGPVVDRADVELPVPEHAREIACNDRLSYGLLSLCAGPPARCRAVDPETTDSNPYQTSP